jgi:hypothetical protein
MFPSQIARNIAFFIDFYVFSDSGILSNTLQICVSRVPLGFIMMV